MISEHIGAVRLFFTLVGILGSLFAIHLANWFREALKLKQKSELRNRDGSQAETYQQFRECKNDEARLFNHVPILMAVILTGFVVLVCVLSGMLLYDSIPNDRIALFTATVIGTYFIIYIVLTLYFLIGGFVFIRRSIRKSLEKP